MWWKDFYFDEEGINLNIKIVTGSIFATFGIEDYGIASLVLHPS
jgi:hypothetical protein